MSNFIDRTGQRFGKLTAMRFAKTVGGRSGWEVKCDCGNTYIIETNNLTKRIRIGCKKCADKAGRKRIDITRQRFGALVAVSVSYENHNKGRWKCICDCGDEHYTTVTNLRNGRSTMCAKCCSSRRGIKLRNYLFGQITQNYWNSINRGATTRNIEINISPKYAYELYKSQSGKCALTGMQIGFHDMGKFNKSTASLDRIDSHVGYIDGNVQWVHRDVNLMKNSFDQRRFIEICQMVSSKQIVTPQD